MSQVRQLTAILTADTIIAALPPKWRAYAADDVMVAGAHRALDEGFETAAAAARFAVAYRSGFLAGRRAGPDASAPPPAAPSAPVLSADAEAAARTAERNRIGAILALDEAQNRPATAENIAMNTALTVDQAKGFLAGMPLEVAAAPTWEEQDDGRDTGIGLALFEPSDPTAFVQEHSPGAVAMRDRADMRKRVVAGINAAK